MFNTLKGIANISADSVSEHRAVGLYYNLDFNYSQQELRTAFEPLPPVEQSTHTPTEVQEFFIKPKIENLLQNYNTQNTLPVTHPEESKLSLDNASPKDFPQLEQKFLLQTELTPEKIIQLQKIDTLCNNIIQDMHCNTNENYFTDTMDILHKMSDFNSTFSQVVGTKYLLNASHNYLGHIGATTLYHFLKHKYVRSCQKCQIMKLQKPNYINLTSRYSSNSKKSHIN